MLRLVEALEVPVACACGPGCDAHVLAGKMQSGRFRDVSCFPDHRASLNRAEHRDELCTAMAEVTVTLSMLC